MRHVANAVQEMRSTSANVSVKQSELIDALKKNDRPPSITVDTLLDDDSDDCKGLLREVVQKEEAQRIRQDLRLIFKEYEDSFHKLLKATEPKDRFRKIKE